MRTRGAICLAVMGLAVAALPGSAQERPLSVIDWLSDSLSEPPSVQPAPPPTTGSAPVDPISVTALDETEAAAVGLLPATRAGLPADLWAASTPTEIAMRLADLPTGLTPALQDLLFTLLLAELDPPTAGDPADVLFLARIDTLLRFGALDDARALIERAGRMTPDIFRRYFDVSLLTGEARQACADLTADPNLAPSFPARVFCLAREGQWDTAALTLGTGEAIGVIEPAEADLLHRFLDPAMAEDSALPTPPRQPTPLEMRLYEAIGEAIQTTTMPLAFAHADLSDQTGWRAQLEAAERLAQAGSMDANRLLGLYTENKPAASGGVWDRAAAMQALDAALASGDADAVAEALPDAVLRMEEAGLIMIPAALYAERLAPLTLTGAAADHALRLRFLSDRYEVAAQTDRARQTLPVLSAIARGAPNEATGGSAIEQTLLDAFRASGIPERYRADMDAGALGAAILAAMGHFERGAAGELDDLSDAVAFFRAVGLQDTARRASIQALLATE